MKSQSTAECNSEAVDDMQRFDCGDDLELSALHFAMAREQSGNRGIEIQAYVKMLLHEALQRNQEPLNS